MSFPSFTSSSSLWDTCGSRTFSRRCSRKRERSLRDRSSRRRLFNLRWLLTSLTTSRDFSVRCIACKSKECLYTGHKPKEHTWTTSALLENFIPLNTSLGSVCRKSLEASEARRNRCEAVEKKADRMRIMKSLRPPTSPNIMKMSYTTLYWITI